MISNSNYGIIENGAIAVKDSTIVWIGKGDLVPELNAKKTEILSSHSKPSLRSANSASQLATKKE